MVISEIPRKYRVKYSENKQKSEKSEFFYEKKKITAPFFARNEIFFVILRAIMVKLPHGLSPLVK